MAPLPEHRGPAVADDKRDAPRPFDVRTIEYLLRLMSDHDLSEIALQEGDQRIRLRRGTSAAPAFYPAPQAAAPHVSHAAPAIVFLQYGSQEKFLNAERAVQYAAIVSEPKRLKIYDAPHALNAEARRDRIQFLTEQLKLRPLPASAIASIPNLYQPADQ